MFTPLLSLPMFGMPGLPEMIVIGIIVVVIFGATKLPKLGKGLGEGIRNFKTGLKSEEETDTLDDTEKKSKATDKFKD